MNTTTSTRPRGKSLDGRQRARENEVRLLRALHRFGWLRTRDLAALCWQRWASRPSSTLSLAPTQPTASGLRMAQRTLCRLREARLVITTLAPDGSRLHALSEGGARFLKDAGLAAVTGKDLVRGHSAAFLRHRCIANEVAISGIVQGYRVSTERETARGLWLGGTAGIAGKRPDVLLRHGSQVWWVEIDKSRRNAKDHAFLLAWLTKVLRDKARPDGGQLLGLGLMWARVVFVCTPAAKAKLCRDLVTAGWSESHIASLISFECALYSFADISFLQS
jgi:hypothetical protein